MRSGLRYLYEESPLINWTSVDEALNSAVLTCSEDSAVLAHRRRYVFPGAVLLVGLEGEVVYHKAFGCRSLSPSVTPMTRDVVFDVASLTKPLITTTLIMQCVERGILSVDRRLSRIFQTFGTYGKEKITVRHLLNHTSGYPATAPFYKQIARLDNGARTGVMTSRGAVETVLNEIFRAKIEHSPGQVTRYSDIGFILLGRVLEIMSGGMTLDKLATNNIFKQLGMHSSGFIDLAALRRRGLKVDTSMIAPTAECQWRGRVLCGEVHDENAWVMGGVAPHAGLFTTAYDVHRFAAEMIRCWHGKGKFLGKDIVRDFWCLDGMDPRSTWALGWDTPSLVDSSSGHHFSANSVGHLGYTGCSLWIDVRRRVHVVLLSNRIHPTAENNAIREFRPHLHDLVMEALGFSAES